MTEPYIKLGGEAIPCALILEAAQNGLTLAMGNKTEAGKVKDGHWSTAETIRYNLGNITAGG